MKWTILTISMFAISALAMPAMADMHEEPESDKKSEMQEKRQMRQAEIDAKRDQAKQHMADKRADFQEKCAAKHNATECEDKGPKEPGKQARREAHAILGAIKALENRVGKLEVKEYQLEAKLASGELNETESERANATLEKIEAHQGKAIEKILHLKAKLEAIKERWQAAHDYVKDREADEARDEDDSGDEVDAASDEGPEAESESESDDQS